MPVAAAIPAPGLPVVLGSGSTGRGSVLQRRGLAFTVQAADIDEKAVEGRSGASPSDLALAVARAKADALRSTLKDKCILITADQVVVGPDGAPREKPSSPQEARAFLASYANATSSTVSAVVVTNTVTGQSAEGVAIETIHYGPGLAEESVVDDCLQPAIPVDARKLRANLRVAASALSSSSSSSSSASAGGASADGSAKRRRSARLSGAGASAVPTVSVLVTAGAVMIEHPSIAPHITAIERGGAHGSASSSSSSGAATNSSSGSTANDDDDVVDSIYGLPWRLTQQLIARVSPGHPWATLS